MQRSKHLPFLLSVAVTLGLLQMFGCAAPAQPTAVAQPPASGLEKFDQAEQAYNEQDYERARDLFGLLAQDPQELSDEQVTVVQTHLRRINSILHQRALAQQEEVAEAAEAAEVAEAPPPEVVVAEAAPTEPAEAEAEEAAAEPAAVELPEPEEAAEEAEVEAVEPEPLDPEVAQQMAVELLAAVQELCAQEQFEQAVSQFDALDPLREHLSLPQKAQYDELRDLTQQATGQLAPLSRRDRKARAQEQFDAGIAAYKSNDYVAASLHLKAAASFDIGIGWLDNRKLRSTRQTVDSTLVRLRADYVTAGDLYEAGDYTQAEAVLNRIGETGVHIGDREAEGMDRLLADISEKAAELERQELEAQRSRAVGLLTEARGLIADRKHGEAADSLEGLAGMLAYLDEGQKQEFEHLRAEVEEATGLLPGMSPQERLRKAEQYFDWGMKAYRGKRYAGAKEYLDRTAQLDVGLGWWDNRTLRRTRKKVDARLAPLVADYERGRELYAAEDFAAATAALERVKASGINIGDAEAEEMDAILAAISQRETARVEEAVLKVDALMAEARRLVPSDLVTAEKKVIEAADLAQQEAVALTGAQIETREFVREAVEARYGLERRARPEQYGLLVEFSDQYGRRGEHEKAKQLLVLVKDASGALVAEDYRSQAVGKLAAAERAAAQQQEAAGELAGSLEQSRAELERGEQRKALSRIETAVRTAKEQEVAGPLMAGVLQEAVALLEADFERAAAAARAEAKELLDAELAAGRVAMARSLSEFYLANKGADLAEPYLRKLTSEPEHAQWARAQLASVGQLAAEARQLRLLLVGGEAARVRELEAEVSALKDAGQSAQARLVEARLADAQLELQVKKARHALERGAYTEAVRSLEEAPADKASGSLAIRVYEPVRLRLRRLRAAAVQLRDAEQALAADDLRAAGVRLRRVEAAALEAKPLQIKKEALVAVLESALKLREDEMALAAQTGGALRSFRAELAALSVREEAWQRYYGALAGFLRGDEDGRAALHQTLAQQPAGLQQFELRRARQMLATLAKGEGEPAVAVTQAALAEARARYAEGDNVAAAELLVKLRGMTEFLASEALWQGADELAEQIRQKEKRAEELYALAVEARNAGDAARVGELIAELKADYAGTRAFRDRR